MSILNIIGLAGGLAVFIYGMTIMGKGLEKYSGGKMEKVLSKLTSNPFLSVVVGMVVTATVQSSSATTVIIVGLVNAKILTLRQAIGVIMGANIGTTVTSQIIRLSDLSSDNIFLLLLKPSTLAPVAAIAGVVLFLFTKKASTKDLGQILLGFSILFTGLFAMEDAVYVLRDSPAFVDLFSTLSNPFLGVLAGAGVTAIIQSSSASVGILQAISATGILTFSSAFPIIMGQNIGTCVTPILSSIGASKNAKRSAMVHLYFNILGTLIVLFGFYGYQAVFGEISMWNDPITRTGIANFHTLFNVAVTLMFMPFMGLLEKLARATIKDPAEKQEAEANLLDERLLMSPSIAIEQSRTMLLRMAHGAADNYHNSVSLLDRYDFKVAERINEAEDTIDRIDDMVENYLIKLATGELSENESQTVTTLMHLIREYERVGDYAVNIMEVGKEMYEKDLAFSDSAMHEIGTLCSAVGEIISLSIQAVEHDSLKFASDIEPLEETIDAIVDKLKDRHIERLKNGKCSVYAGISFLNILTDLERMADHCSNIALYITAGDRSDDDFNKHRYLEKKHRGEDPAYVELYDTYMAKYFSVVEHERKA